MSVRRTRRDSVEADQLALRAFRDAVRDILADQGRVELEFPPAPEAVATWGRLPMAEA